MPEARCNPAPLAVVRLRAGNTIVAGRAAANPQPRQRRGGLENDASAGGVAAPR